jgi:enamine deaminase RidA (YjgF/YER057c/UK114 family)
LRREFGVDLDARIREIGLEVPDLESDYEAAKFKAPSGARYISHYANDNLLYLSGTVPKKNGEPYLTGVVGEDLSVEEGYEAARYAALTSLSVLKYALGDLNRVQQIVQMIGYVNSSPGFNDQSRVINGATDLFIELYGIRGKATRAAIGCRGLALNSSVEIIPTVLFSGETVRQPLETSFAV